MSRVGQKLNELFSQGIKPQEKVTGENTPTQKKGGKTSDKIGKVANFVLGIKIAASNFHKIKRAKIGSSGTLLRSSFPKMAAKLSQVASKIRFHKESGYQSSFKSSFELDYPLFKKVMDVVKDAGLKAVLESPEFEGVEDFLESFENNIDNWTGGTEEKPTKYSDEKKKTFESLNLNSKEIKQQVLQLRNAISLNENLSYEDIFSSTEQSFATKSKESSQVPEASKQPLSKKRFVNLSSKFSRLRQSIGAKIGMKEPKLAPKIPLKAVEFNDRYQAFQGIRARMDKEGVDAILEDSQAAGVISAFDNFISEATSDPRTMQDISNNSEKGITRSLKKEVTQLKKKINEGKYNKSLSVYRSTLTRVRELKAKLDEGQQLSEDEQVSLKESCKLLSKILGGREDPDAQKAHAERTFKDESGDELEKIKPFINDRK